MLLAVVPALTLRPVGTPAPSPARPSGLTAFGAGVCSGGKSPGTYNGSATILGGPLATPAAANVSVAMDYAYLFNYTTATGHTTFTCESGNASAVANAHGRFTINASIPATICNRVGCSTFTGPFGAPRFGVVPGPPAGYFLRSAVAGGTVGLSIVHALESVTVAPAGRWTVSVNAPSELRSQALAADGSPSPAQIRFEFSLAGDGWSFVAPAAGGNVSVIAAPGASIGTFTVRANGSYGGAALTAPPVSDELTAVATAIGDAGLAATSVDAGASVGVALNASGAAGYAYTAEVAPGLGAASESVACMTQPAPGGTVAIACAGPVRFATAGTAQPVVQLTNGYSSDAWRLASVEVADPLAITVTPTIVRAYANSSFQIQVAVAGGTGTAPFGPACVDPGDGVTVCAAGPSSAWSLTVAAPVVGDHEGRATVRDAGGSNVSLAFPTVVSARPALGALALTTSAPVAGSVDAVRGYLVGGAFPATFWWNLSSPATTVASGTVGAGGLLAANLSFSVPGPTNLTLTVADALGTVVASAAPIVVLPGPPDRLVFGTVGANRSAAGTAVPLALTATDLFGDAVGPFAAVVNLTVVGPVGSVGGAWVNGSFGATFLAGSGGFAQLPAAAWSRGALGIEFTATAAGRWAVLASAGAGTGPLTASAVLEVGADAAHLRLADPRVATPGARTNDTLYTVTDRFGNALAGGFLVVRAVFGPAVSIVQSRVEDADGISTVWVNYSAPNADAGAVYVESALGGAVLATLYVPAFAPPTVGSSVLVAVAAVAAIAVASFVVTLIRRRSRPGPAVVPVEAELERLAVGRAHVLARLARDGPLAADDLEEGCPAPRPTATEVADWLESLVTEGAVLRRRTPYGAWEYAAADPSPESTPAPLQIDLDPAALERALGRRDAEREDVPPPA